MNSELKKEPTRELDMDMDKSIGEACNLDKSVQHVECVTVPVTPVKYVNLIFSLHTFPTSLFHIKLYE